jgi:hypothetical protein
MKFQTKKSSLHLQCQIIATILKLLNTYLAMLGMVTTEGNELLAYRTTSVRFPLADLCMLNNTFHLLTAWEAAISITTLTSMHQRLYTALDRQLSCFL